MAFSANKHIAVLDNNLRAIAPRACYGASQMSGSSSSSSSLLLVGDEEFVISSGANLRIYNDGAQSSHFISPQIASSVAVSIAVLSRDRSLLAVVCRYDDRDEQRELHSHTQSSRASAMGIGAATNTVGLSTSVLKLDKEKADEGAATKHPKNKTATMYLYDMSSQVVQRSKKPRVITHSIEKWNSDWPDLSFSCVAISTCNTMAAGCFNVSEVGTYLFDALTGQAMVKMDTTVDLKGLSFYPDESTKICTIGDLNTLSMWRMSGNGTAYVSPVHGLPMLPNNCFTCLEWLPKSPGDEEQWLVVGSTLGFISLVSGTDQRQPCTWAFGAPSGYNTPMQENYKASPVTALLSRGDVVIAVGGQSHLLTILEVKKYGASNGNSGTAVLIPLQRLELGPNITKIMGITWTSATVSSSYEVALLTPTALLRYDTEADRLGSKAGIETGLSTTGGKAGAAVTYVAKPGEYIGGIYNDTGSKPLLGEAPGSAVTWRQVDLSRQVTQFHSGSINSLSVSTRTSQLLCASDQDESLRMVDYSQPTGPNFATADFSGERRAENPFSSCMHPSGFYFAVACEDEAVEMISADTGLETIRRIPTKVPFTLPNGTPFVNMHPVSLVKYSHSGNLLAVVTHKHARIFNMFRYEVNGQDSSLAPTLVAALMDHTAPITDLTFSRDDTMVYTTSTDGSLYAWKVGKDKRCDDFVQKAMSASKVCCGDEGMVLAAFTPDVGAMTNSVRDAMKTVLGGGINSTGMNTPYATPGSALGDNAPRTPGSSPSRHRQAMQGASTRTGGRNALGNQYTGGGSEMSGSRENSRGGMSTGGRRRQSVSRGPSGGVVEDGGDVGPERICGEKLRVNPQSMLIWWLYQEQGLSQDRVNTLYVDGVVLSMALGKVDTSGERRNVCCLGLADGRLLVSFLPFPTHVLNATLFNPYLALATAATGPGIGINGRHDAISLASSSVDNEESRSGTAGASSSSALGREDSFATHSVLDVTGVGGDSIPSRGLGATLTPMSVTQRAASLPADNRVYLDENKVRSMQLHSSGITAVTISTNGLWIFTGGADGVVYMLSTSLRARNLQDVPERTKGLENQYVVTDREMLAAMRHRLTEVDQIIVDKTRESNRIINKLRDENLQKVEQLEVRMKREMEKRDDIIIKTREDMIRTNKALHKKVAEATVSKDRAIEELESEYEKKLSKEALYLAKMRQAYDEFVLHARMDMADFEKEVQSKKLVDTEKHTMDLKEEERQKEALVTYIEYVKARNMEIIEALDHAQADERHTAKTKLEEAEIATENAAQQGRSEIAQLQIELQKSKMETGKKEDDAIRLGADLGWANERIKKLERGLHEATSNLTLAREQSNKWEFKCGEQAQQLHDLERIRKALTHQLHNLRTQMGPEKEKLSQMTEKLHEVDREYELSLHAISEKDATIVRRGSHMQLMQRQVREMRYSMSQKDKALARAAKILAEYSVALKEAEFEAFKRTIEISRGGEKSQATGHAHFSSSQPLPNTSAGAGEEAQGGDDYSTTSNHQHKNRSDSSPTRPKAPSLADFIGKAKRSGMKGGNHLEARSEVVEVMKRTTNMDSALKRLCELLLPFEEKVTNVVIEDEGSEAIMERERHVSQLHRRLTNLQGSLDRTEEVAITKVKKSLSENQVLVEEVNTLRHRLKAVTKDNQRQKASLDMMRLKLEQNQNYDGHRNGGHGNDRGVNLEDSRLEHSQNGRSNGSPDARSNNGQHATQSSSFAIPAPKAELFDHLSVPFQSHRAQGGGHPFARSIEQTHSQESLGGGLRPSDVSLSEYLKQEEKGAGIDEAKASEGHAFSTKTGSGAVPHDSYVPPYSSGDGSAVLSEKERKDAQEELKREAEVKAAILRDVNETSKRAQEAVQRNREAEGSKAKAGEKPLSGLALEDSVSSLKTADEKIAAIMAENDAKIKSMRSQSSAQEILSYYQTQLSDVDVPPGNTNNGVRQNSTAKTSRPTSSTQKTSANVGSTASSRENSAAAYRPLSKGAALKQSALNSTVQLPDIRNSYQK